VNKAAQNVTLGWINFDESGLVGQSLTRAKNIDNRIGNGHLTDSAAARFQGILPLSIHLSPALSLQPRGKLLSHGAGGMAASLTNPTTPVTGRITVVTEERMDEKGGNLIVKSRSSCQNWI